MLKVVIHIVIAVPSWLTKYVLNRYTCCKPYLKCHDYAVPCSVFRTWEFAGSVPFFAMNDGKVSWCFVFADHNGTLTYDLWKMLIVTLFPVHSLWSVPLFVKLKRSNLCLYKRLWFSYLRASCKSWATQEVLDSPPIHCVMKKWSVGGTHKPHKHVMN